MSKESDFSRWNLLVRRLKISDRSAGFECDLVFAAGVERIDASFETCSTVSKMLSSSIAR